MENTNWKTSVQQGAKKFVDSWISLVLFSSILVVISAIQVFLFIFTDVTMSGFGSEDSQAWVTWAYILISFPFGISSVLGMTLSIRGSKHFIVFALIVELGYLVSGLSAGMMYSTIIIGMLMFVNLYRYYKIRTEGEDYKVNEKLINWILISMLIAIFITGIISIELDDNNVFWWNTSVYGDSKAILYLDVVTAIFTFAGGVMVLTKNKLAFIAFIICDVCFLILFINAHQWSNVCTTIMYLILEVLGFIVWSIKEEV